MFNVITEFIYERLPVETIEFVRVDIKSVFTALIISDNSLFPAMPVSQNKS